MNRQIGELVCIVKALTEKKSNSREENCQYTSKTIFLMLQKHSKALQASTKDS